MIGQRKLVLIRKESKQVSVFISKEPKQSLGLGSKLVKVIQVKVDISKVVLYLYTLFDFGFYTSCDKVALRPSGGERAPLMEIYFLLLWGQRRDRELLFLLFLFLRWFYFRIISMASGSNKIIKQTKITVLCYFYGRLGNELLISFNDLNVFFFTALMSLVYLIFYRLSL